MGRPDVDLFILEFIKVYYGNGNFKHLERLFSNSSLERLTKRLCELEAAAFFYDAVSSGKVPLHLPPEMLKEWKMLARKVAIQNMLYENEGGKVLKGLYERGVRCILLKGFSYMEKLYGNTWTRPVSDLDILISYEDFPCVKEYLLTNEFTMFRSDFVREWDRINGKLLDEQHFFKRFGVCPLNLDFHWVRVPGDSENELQYDLNGSDWTKNTDCVYFGEVEADCLNLEMLFIHCVDHYALHHTFYKGFKWFIDLCQFVVRLGEQLDWSFIRSVVTEPNSRKAFGITLRLIEEVVGKAGPAAGNWRDFWPGRGLPGEFFLYRRQLLSVSPKTILFIYQLLFPVRMKDKFKILSFLLFSENRNTFSAFGRQLTFLRPLYVLYKGVEELFSRLQKSKKEQLQ
jgi:hypothetical protein